MGKIRLISFVFIQTVLLNLVLTDEIKDGKTHCTLIEISNTWFHRSLEGVYRLKGPASYNCNNRSVYQLDKEDSYLFYITQGSWEGWMVGKYECVNKGYLSVGDKAQYPDEINKTWEEYNSLKWLFNKDIISGCHLPGVTRPPRIKVKPPKVKEQPKTEFNVSTSAVIDHEQKSSSILSDRTMAIVIYVAVPTGCLVILALLVILCILAGTHKSFLKRLTKDNQEKKVNYDGKRVTVTPKLAAPATIVTQDETDSVFEVLADPEDASSQAYTTPPAEPAKSDGKM